MNQDRNMNFENKKVYKKPEINWDDLQLVKELDLGDLKIRLHQIGDKFTVDIRHYYKEKPTKKGVRMPLEIFNLIKDKF